MVLESALDHFLQALFAANHSYFPSRKRTEKYIEGFLIKPENCYARLLEVVKNATDENTIEKSVENLQKMTAELRSLT